jgi:hypothetical protein
MSEPVIHRGSGVSPAGYRSGTASGNGADFRTLLSDLYSKPIDVMQQFADPTVDQINIEGYAPVDKDEPVAAMIASYYLNDVQLQMESCMNYMNFIYKTVPQFLEKIS